MKKTLSILALVPVLLSLGLPCTVFADKRFPIHSPRGGVITLVITSCALGNIKIHDLDFSNSGESFLLAAEPLRSSGSMHTISIGFHEGSNLVQSEYVDIGPDETTHEVYCPEDFDQIVIDCSGY